MNTVELKKTGLVELSLDEAKSIEGGGVLLILAMIIGIIGWLYLNGAYE